MERPLDNVAVVGAGILGAQIALLAAHAGYRVRCYDPRAGALAETLNKIRRDLENKKAVVPLVPFALWDSTLARVRSDRTLEDALAGADLVIEAAPENLELKKKVWKDLGDQAPAKAILATNSSSLPVSRMEEAGGRPQQSLNIHFYFPLQGVNHVDVMGGTATTPETMAAGIKWVRSLGCIPLTVNKELLGFCFNRVWRAIKRETLYMWGGGFVDFRDVDRGWMVFTGMKEGPFAIMDKVGLDVVRDIEMVYYRESGDPRDHPPQALLDMIERGDLGVKSGRGFYSYPDPEYLAPGFLS
ncbi:MAG: 3-hydroxyacyl-CoA dehydrogenase NAD-binding domain-containing protein [Pseudomonadota bacterium]